MCVCIKLFIFLYKIFGIRYLYKIIHTEFLQFYIYIYIYIYIHFLFDHRVSRITQFVVGYFFLSFVMRLLNI